MFLLLLLHFFLLAAVVSHCGDYNPRILWKPEQPITLAEMDALYPKEYKPDDWIRVWRDDADRLAQLGADAKLDDLEYRGIGFWPKLRGPVRPLVAEADQQAERTIVLADIDWCEHYVPADDTTGAQAALNKKMASVMLAPK